MSSYGDLKFKPARIIFFIRNKEVNEVYYVIDLTETMYESITAKSWRTPITPKPCEKFSYQKKKLCMTLNNQGPWKRDQSYDTGRNLEKRKTFALQLIDSMLTDVNQQQTADQVSDETALPNEYLIRQRYLRQHENPVKRMEYLHLRDKINVWPPESLGFMFYYLENDVEFHASHEPGINPVLTSWLEQLNYPSGGEAPVNSGGVGMGIKDFQEGMQDGPSQSEYLQSGVILYRGPKVPSPDPNNRDIALNAHLETANKFNERRVKHETQIIKNEQRSAIQKLYPGTIVPSGPMVLRILKDKLLGRGGKSKRVKRFKSKRVKRRTTKRRN